MRIAPSEFCGFGTKIDRLGIITAAESDRSEDNKRKFRYDDDGWAEQSGFFPLQGASATSEHGSVDSKAAPQPLEICLTG